MSQFLNTLDQIVHSDSVGTIEGIRRHCQWQVRKLLNRFPCALPFAGSRLYVDRPGGVAALVNAMGEYDYNNMALLRMVLSRENSTFLDIGANIGAYTLIASENPHVSVIAIEAHPSTFPLLAENIKLNARKNVTCLNIAVSNANGAVRFSDYEESCLNRVVKPGETELNTLTVSCRRVEDVCLDLRVNPDFVKIDVEGHEQFVLEGFGSLLGAVKMMFVECGERPEIRQIMEAGGYSGPCFFHFKQKCFSKLRQPRPEDSIYISQSYLSKLMELGIAAG